MTLYIEFSTNIPTYDYIYCICNKYPYKVHMTLYIVFAINIPIRYI